jgi:serine/threonine-protein phosphatase 4 regulatory subunit 4
MLLEYMSPEIRQKRVMPLLRHHMQHLSLDVTMQQCIADLFGTILTAVSAQQVFR